MDAPTCRASLVYDESLTAYDFGPTHPMNPIRVDLTVELADAIGVLDTLPRVPAPDATEDDLATVHEPGLIEAVMAAGKDPSRHDLVRGLGTEDDPTFPHMHEASRHVVGASIEAARQVWTGQVDHAANIAGGLHHAMPDRASGFCVYNDVAVAIRWLLDNGAEKVAYVDVDVHHGDGVEHVFYDDPRVLTISLHETGQMLFPGTGFPADSADPRRRDPPSTWPCRPAPPTRAGCAPSTPSCRRWCASSHRTCWSPSRAATATATIPWPTSRSVSTASGRATSRCTTSRTRRRAGAGSPSAGAATPWSTWSRAPGPTCSRSSPGRPLDPAVETPASWRGAVAGRLGVRCAVDG